MSNDSLRHEFGEILALVQDQMQDLTSMQQKRAQLVATASAASGSVEVTVNAQHTVTKTVVDEAYLEDYEISDLGGHITAAAQAAARDIDAQMAGMVAPISDRRKAISDISDAAVDGPEISEMLSAVASLNSSIAEPQPTEVVDDIEGAFPRIRR